MCKCCTQQILNVFGTASACVCRVNQREKYDLDVLGLCSRTCRSFKIANILGVHFKSGEWNEKRCGSVITTMYDGRSRYAVVNTFIKAGNKDFASVTWLSKPSYPFAPIPLVVRVEEMNPAAQFNMPSLLPLNRIDPTPILVEPDGDHFYMMRVSGWDRTR